MLRIYHPPSYSPERMYIFDVLLRQFLGLQYEAEIEERHDLRISFEGIKTEKQLRIADDFFQCAKEEWLTSASLPERPLDCFDISDMFGDSPLANSTIPIIYGSRNGDGSYVEEGESGISLGIDIFGSAFFMLTRYEEIVLPLRDSRERFPASASLAYQEGFLDRPIINEYLEILWWSLKRLCPQLHRRQRNYEFVLSHDVDWPLGVYNRTLFQVAKSTVGDVIKRKDVGLALRRLYSAFFVRSGNLDADLNNMFNVIMNISEQHGLKSSFYFIVDHSDGEIDGNYSLEHPWIRSLLRRIHRRGHEIGLHPSYNTFRDKNRIRQQFESLLYHMKSEGIGQIEWGGRQHYLRWEAPVTWQAWEEAGLAYDCTLSFADHAGFRCGVCYEYSVYNLYTRQALHLRERPLIAMEGSLLESEYMGLTAEKTLHHLRKLREQCQRFEGQFSLLWHNSSLIKKQDLNLYQTIVEESAHK